MRGAVRGRVARTAGGALGALAAVVVAMPAGAQRESRRAPAHPEVRIDYLGPRPHTMQAGLGINVSVGTYVRLGVIGAGGASWRDGRTAASARADVTARFALDPFRERRWGLSAGGGLSARYDGDAFDGRRRWRALVAILLDLEGPRIGPAAPALQLGLGGGVRVGVILRRVDRGRR